MAVFYHCLVSGYQNTITVNGILAEGTARKYFYSPVKQRKLNGEITSYAVHFGRNEYAVRVLNEWVEKTKPLCAKVGVDLIDFYTVEQDAANWGALAASEQDIVREEMRPFNSRKLISLFWSLPDNHRFKYNPKIYKSIIRHLWKEALKVPINPSAHSTVFKVLGILGIDRLLFKIYRYLQFLRFRIIKSR